LFPFTNLCYNLVINLAIYLYEIIKIKKGRGYNGHSVIRRKNKKEKERVRYDSKRLSKG
jgi:hypothetical protein